MEVYQDLRLVFLNALYYNEEGSQIAKDAATLKVRPLNPYVLPSHHKWEFDIDTEVEQSMMQDQWKQFSNLPTPSNSPPPSPAQKPRKRPFTTLKLSLPITSSSKRPSTTPVPTPVVGPPSPKRTRTPKPSKTQPQPQPQTQAAPPPPASPEQPNSPDMDIDIGGTPEPDSNPNEVARDGESEAIVKQLERGLPRWGGFADVGWVKDISSVRTYVVWTFGIGVWVC